MTDTEHVLMPVEKLIEGLQVDLAGDPYADPRSDIPSLEFEYAVVESVEEETPTCTAVCFDHDIVGFPHGYQVKVRREGGDPQPKEES